MVTTWKLVGLLATLGMLGVPGRVSGGSEPSAEEELPVAAVEVRSGRADFRLPLAEPTSRHVVIVSALARSTGPVPETCRVRRLPPGANFEPSVRSWRPTEIRPGTVAVRRSFRISDTTKTRHAVPPPRHRTFHLMVREGDPTQPTNYLPVQARLAAVGQGIQVYVDVRDVDTIQPTVLEELVRTFDEHVEPAALRILDRARDTDGDGRFTVLMTGWLSRLGEGRMAVDGLVRAADLDPLGVPPFSNRCDMMYLNAAISSGPHLETVLAHEYAHAVISTVRGMAGSDESGAFREEEGWLDEGMAHLTEDLHGFSRSNLDHRAWTFLAQPERYRLVVRDYFTEELFRSHGHRGAAYLFVRWCGDRFGSETLLRGLAASPRVGVDNIESLAGVPFEELYRCWSIDLVRRAIEPVPQPGADGIPSGPQIILVGADRPPERWEASGTSSRFLQVGGEGDSGQVRVEVEAPPEAALQVTALALPQALPELTLRVQPESVDPNSPSVVVTIRENRGIAAVIDGLNWPGGSLDRGEILAILGTNRLPGGGELRSRRLTLVGATPGKNVPVQVVGRDDRGRRCWAWADAPPMRGTERGAGESGP